MGSAQSLLEIAINKKDWMYQGNEPNTIAYQYNWILGFCEIKKKQPQTLVRRNRIKYWNSPTTKNVDIYSHKIIESVILCLILMI